MRLFITILIVLCTGLIGSLAYMLSDDGLRERFFPTPPELVGKPAINDFKRADITQVEITSADGTKGVFKFKDTYWQGELPWADRAYNMAPIIAFAKFANVQETIPIAEADPSSFGFGSDSHHVVLKNASGETLANFDIGITSPWHAPFPKAEKEFPCIYMRNRALGEEAPTLLCLDPQVRIRDLFEKKLVRLRDYYPVNRFEIDRLQKVSIKRKDSTLELERAPQSNKSKSLPQARNVTWLVKKPLSLRADRAAITKLLNTLKFITAEDIKPLSEVTLPSTAEDNISLKLEFFGKKDPVTLTIYQSTTKNNITLATISDRKNFVFQIPALATTDSPVTYSQLPNNVNDIRSKSLLELDFRYIDTVTIKPSGQAPVLLRLEKDWFLTSLGKKRIRANKKALEGFILSLVENRISKFVSDAPTDLVQYGLDNPALTVYLVDKFSRPQALYFGKTVEYDDGGLKRIGYYAKSASQESVWIVESSVLASMKTQRWEWLPLDITGLSISNVRQLITRRPNRPSQSIDFDYAAERLIVKEGTETEVSKNPVITHEVDINRVRFFIVALCNLKASHRIDPRSITAFNALKKPAMTLELTYEDFDTGQLKRKFMEIAPAGTMRSSQFFYLRDKQSREIFSIDRTTFSNLTTQIRYAK